MQRILRVERQFQKPELNSLLHAIQVLYGACFVFNLEFNSALARHGNVLRGMPKVSDVSYKAVYIESIVPVHRHLHHHHTP